MPVQTPSPAHVAERAIQVHHTAECYRAAWGTPPPRYWLDHEEVERRRDHLAHLYTSIGMGRSGREHSIQFETLAS
ncbi:hypothetical protein [Streptomyces hygroscopicus]|uniref:hypothetical protein n=1 Tax=Streptomyces hygroscopicus TaxID=1912 RepID=UPI0036A8F170